MAWLWRYRQNMDRTDSPGFWWQNALGRRVPVTVAFEDQVFAISGHASLRLPLHQLAAAAFYIPQTYQNDGDKRRWIITLRDTSGRDWRVHASLDVTVGVLVIVGCVVRVFLGGADLPVVLGVLIFGLIMALVGLSGWPRRRRSFGTLEDALAHELDPKA